VVYVHCAAGVSRSASVVIAFLMKEFKMKFQEAFDFVKERRPQIMPNSNFRSQLEIFEKELAEQGHYENITNNK
jgi:protein-tyrosine phosphatase